MVFIIRDSMNNICYIEDCMKICYDKIGRLGFIGCE